MKISILTPTFNSGQYLERAIQSVLNQSYKDWEHIIMDGGSSDDTLELLKRYPHLIWESKPDKGQSDAMNQAFSKATGEILIYLNADDKLANGLFAEVIKLFKELPDVDMVVGNLKIEGRDNPVVSKPSISLQEILDFQKFNFPLNPVSYAYKASLQHNIGPFPLDNHYTMDYWFLLRAYLFGRIKKYEFICGTFYFNIENKSNSEKARKQLYVVRNNFIKEFYYKLPIVHFLIAKIFTKVKRIKLKYYLLVFGPLPLIGRALLFLGFTKV